MGATIQLPIMVNHVRAVYYSKLHDSLKRFFIVRSTSHCKVGNCSKIMLVLLLIFVSVFLGGKHITNGQSVNLTLNGIGIANGSDVLITDIGEAEKALLCITDLASCCDVNRTGEWLFPDRTRVPIKKASDGFYRDRGPLVVRLNRKNGTQSPTGLYCCRILDATLRNRTACANIIRTFGAPENFTALPTNSREIHFSWTLQSHFGADSTSMNISYNLTCRPNAFGVTSVVTTYSEAGSHTLGGFRPATEYNCSIFAFSGNRSGPFTSVNVTTIDDFSLFQLRLTGVNNCSQWVASTDEDRDQKLEYITATVQDSIQNLCQCDLLRDRITDEVFRWFSASDSPQGVVTYRAMIHGTASTSSSQLISHIERWIGGGTNVIIRQELLRVNGSCRDTTTTPEDGGDGPLSNPNSPTATGSNNNNNSFVLIGVALVIGIIAGASITSLIAIITCCVLRHRAHQKKNAQSSPGKRIEATSPMYAGHGEMSLRLHVDNPVIAHEPTNPMEHEYADLSEIGSKQQAQAQAQASQGGQAKTGGYELTQCPAYSAVAHH